MHVAVDIRELKTKTFAKLIDTLAHVGLSFDGSANVTAVFWLF
jgi:hypothetical protein